MRRQLTCLLAAVLGVSLTVSAQAPPATNQAILEELRQIHQLLQTLLVPRPTAPTAVDNRQVVLSIKPGPMLGSTAAPLTMVEFTDLQCPFCRQFHATTFARLKAEYIDTDKLRYFSRDFPLAELHPLAPAAALAARCAGDQGKFWEMRNAILAEEALTKDWLLKEASLLQLDARFEGCLGDARRFQAEISEDMRDAARAGVTGTPTFVIGRSNGDTLDGVMVLGAQSFEEFDARLKALMR